MSKSPVALDKTWTPPVGDTYGSVAIRVVVLKRKKDLLTDGKPMVLPATDDGEPAMEIGEGPLDSYLERPKYGKQCVVFLINGQRHHTADSVFIARDLGFKHIRNRTVVLIDLDRLLPEAVADIIQGSRQGFYEGKVYGAIRDRIVKTLKGDPDLRKLETEAEQDIAALSTGDEAVKRKLDELIEGHHKAGPHVGIGEAEAGPHGGAPKAFGDLKKQDVVTAALSGAPAQDPILALQPDLAALRLRPDHARTFVIRATPPEAWSELELLDARTPDANLRVDLQREGDHATVTLRFVEPEDFDDDEYPLKVGFGVYARFKHREEVRVLERPVIVAPPREPQPPKPPPSLTADPTFLRVVSRQPVRLALDGPSTHIKLRWDGEDALVEGFPPPWTFRARCASLAHFPPMTFGFRGGGRLELLVDTPHGVLPKMPLDFEVEAVGPGGKLLSAKFRAEVAHPAPEPGPRKIDGMAPEFAAQRKPNYNLVYVKESQFETAPPCWDGQAWTAAVPGYFSDPTESQPLTLYINEDTTDVKAYRDEMAKRLDESTVVDRVAKYTAQVAFHLYQMYEFHARREQEFAGAPEGPRPPEDSDLRDEIARVATTILRLSR